MISSLHFLTFYNSLYHNPDYQQERKKGEKKPKPTNQPNKQTNKQTNKKNCHNHNKHQINYKVVPGFRLNTGDFIRQMLTNL